VNIRRQFIFETKSVVLLATGKLLLLQGIKARGCAKCCGVAAVDIVNLRCMKLNKSIQDCPGHAEVCLVSHLLHDETFKELY
jgi:hypothetical protein